VADDSLTAEDVADNAVRTAEIVNGTILAADLAPGAVTEAKLDAEAVTTPKLAPGAVTPGKLQDGAVTDAKLAAGAVTSAKVAEGSLDLAKLARVAGEATVPVSATSGACSAHLIADPKVEAGDRAILNAVDAPAGFLAQPQVATEAGKLPFTVCNFSGAEPAGDQRWSYVVLR
jgi:hypothetical protein